MVRIARDQGLASFMLAVLLTLCANVLFPLQDALTKQLITTLPVWAVLFVRSAAVLAGTLAIGRARLVRHVLVTPWKGFLAIRAGVMLCGWVAFYLSIRSLGFGQAVTIYFVSPILVALAAKSLFSVNRRHGHNGRRSRWDSPKSDSQAESLNSDFHPLSLSPWLRRASGPSRF